TRHPVPDAAIPGGEFETGAAPQRVDVCAVELLPRRLADRRGGRRLATATLDFFLGDQRVAASGVEVDAYPVPRPQPRQAAARRAFGRNMDDRRAVGRARLAAVAERRQASDAASEQRIRRLHVDHFRAARPADGPGVADPEDAALVDPERRIVDPPVVIFRVLEHDRADFEYSFLPRLLEVAGAKLARDHADLHDREVEQVAGQRQEAGVGHDRILVRANHVAVARLDPGQVVRNGRPGDGNPRSVEPARPQQFGHHRGNAAGTMEAFSEVIAGWLQVDQQGDVVAGPAPVIGGELDAGVAGHRADVRLGVGRSTERADQRDRVEKGFAGQDARGPQVLVHHLDDAATGPVSYLPPRGI